MAGSAGLGAGGLASGMGMPGSNPLLGLAAGGARMPTLPATAPGMPTLGSGTGAGLGALSTGLGSGGLGALGAGGTTGITQMQLAQLLQNPGALQALIAARGQGAS